MLRGDRRRRSALARLPRSIATVAPVGEAVLLLQRIPPDLQELAVYSAIDQMSQDEIALVLGVSQKTVSNRLHALRALLDPAEPSLNEMRK